MNYKLMLFSLLILLISCSNKLSKLNSCGSCSTLLGDDFFVDYPYLKYKVVIKEGMHDKPRVFSTMKERQDSDGKLKIVDKNQMELLYSLKYCFIGLNVEELESYCSEAIPRTKTTSKDGIELKFCFDYGNVAGHSPAGWIDYLCMTWDFTKTKSKYIFLGSDSDKTDLETCKEVITMDMKKEQIIEELKKNKNGKN